MALRKRYGFGVEGYVNVRVGVEGLVRVRVRVGDEGSDEGL